MATDAGTTEPRTTWAYRHPSAPKRPSRTSLRLALAAPEKPGEPTGIHTSPSSFIAFAPSAATVSKSVMGPPS
ncbi:MAG: hypothetical protein CVV51_05790 [Spirochaetae bacterium HGW-Spirochaetae-7]|nr:MAG: hypothetical protein CVV51_05790 [Spirochaetae bacterium HGW-Spirochaetae-7]